MSKPLVMITGASSGIGAAIAKTFSEAGYCLALLARDQAAMQALNLPNTICIQTDVSDRLAFEQAVLQAEDRYGPTECLINNAGYAKAGDFCTLTPEEHEKTFQVNLFGVLHGIEAVLPKMRERRSGTIINISSVADRSVRPNLPSYAASKAAVKSLSESLRQANGQYGIRVCNIAPAKVNTPMMVASALPESESIAVQEMAQVVLWVYEQPKHICIRDLVIAPTEYEP